MSQRSEGWYASKTTYDDGGFSGGSLDRPALEKLIADIKAKKVNIVVVYKIDRLTRSLSLRFDEYGVTFVSVTQNTTTSMGRLTLNVLLSFAQFEREVSGERIRDKIAASKAKGMWQGGRPPFGFDIGDRRLITNEEDAPKAKQIFELYLKSDNVRSLELELRKHNIRSRERISQRGLKYGGEYFSRGALYSLLQNPVYIGKISHKGEIHEGLHDAIISQDLWDAVQRKLHDQAPHERGLEKQKHNNLLTGLIFDEHANPYTPVFTNKKDKKYRYYCNQALTEDKAHPNYQRARFPAHEIEGVIEKAVRGEWDNISGEDEGTVLTHLLKHGDAIPTYELIRTCVKHITVHFDHLVIHLKPRGFKKLAKKHLQISVAGREDEFEITVPFQTKRGRDGAMVIHAKGRDIFDLPPEDLKRLAQGVIWRDEHFAGAHIKEIAMREKCSSRCIRNAIMYSFDTLIAA